MASDLAVSWAVALAWRSRRHLLAPVGPSSTVDVVRRLVAVPAQFDDTAELMVRSRRQSSRPGGLARGVVDGRLIRTYAFRGATHYFAAEDAGIYLALRAAGRQWELPSWQEHYQLRAADWDGFRETVREALAAGPRTRAELGRAVAATPRFRHLGPAIADGSVLEKPLCWLGEMSFGPPRDGQSTFQGLATRPRWAGLPTLDEAGVRAIEAYLRAYGPATPDHLQYWLGDGLSAGRRRIRSWLDQLDDRLAPVTVDGVPALVLAADRDELHATRAAPGVVRLLPGYDPWVLGAGTADPHVVPPDLRAAVSRKANLVLAAGTVAGTWTRRGDDVEVAWSAASGRRPTRALTAEVDRLATILDRPLRLTYA